MEIVFDMPRRVKRRTVALEQLVEAAPYEEALRGFCERNGLSQPYNLYTDTRDFARLPAAAQEQLRVEAVRLLEKHRQQIAEQEARKIEASIAQHAAHPHLFEQPQREAAAVLESKALPKFVISNTYSAVTAPEPGETAAAAPVESVNDAVAVCAQCFKDIRAEDASLALGDFTYHWDCVACAKCGRTLEPTNCLVEGEKAMCARCEASFFAICSGCGDFIVSHDFEQLPAGAGQVLHWHRKCWKCASCARVAALELRAVRSFDS